MTLAQHLDRSLGPRLSVHAHAHLSKRACIKRHHSQSSQPRQSSLTCAENLADSVVVAQLALSSAHKVGGAHTRVLFVSDRHGV